MPNMDFFPNEPEQDNNIENQASATKNGDWQESFAGMQKLDLFEEDLPSSTSAQQVNTTAQIHEENEQKKKLTGRAIFENLFSAEEEVEEPIIRSVPQPTVQEEPIPDVILPTSMPSAPQAERHDESPAFPQEQPVQQVQTIPEQAEQNIEQPHVESITFEQVESAVEQVTTQQDETVKPASTQEPVRRIKPIDWSANLLEEKERKAAAAAAAVIQNIPSQPVLNPPPVLNPAPPMAPKRSIYDESAATKEFQTHKNNVKQTKKAATVEPASAEVPAPQAAFENTFDPAIFDGEVPISHTQELADEIAKINTSSSEIAQEITSEFLLDDDTQEEFGDFEHLEEFTTQEDFSELGDFEESEDSSDFYHTQSFSDEDEFDTQDDFFEEDDDYTQPEDEIPMPRTAPIAHRERDYPGSFDNKKLLIFVGIAAVLLVILILVYFLFFKDQEKPAVAPSEPQTSSSASASQPSVSSQETSSAPEQTQPEPAADPIPRDEWYLKLVNRDNALDSSFAPPELTKVQNMPVDSRIASALQQMIDDAKKEGINLQITVGYRTYARQAAAFKNGTTDSPAGTSEHNLGLSADIQAKEENSYNAAAFEKTKAFEWLRDNAIKYGFILRYPKDKEAVTKFTYEPWHYRYVGTEQAQKIKDSGLTLEEYLAQ